MIFHTLSSADDSYNSMRSVKSLDPLFQWFRQKSYSADCPAASHTFIESQQIGYKTEEKAKNAQMESSKHLLWRKSRVGTYYISTPRQFIWQPIFEFLQFAFTFDRIESSGTKWQPNQIRNQQVSNPFRIPDPFRTPRQKQHPRYQGNRPTYGRSETCASS